MSVLQEKFRRHSLDVFVAASAVGGVVNLVAQLSQPSDARTNVATSLIVLVGALLYVVWLRPRLIAAGWSAYDAGSGHRLLATLIKQAPHRLPLFDPVDEVVLVCRTRARNSDLEVVRIRGEDYAAIALGAQAFLLVETFRLVAWGSRLVSRRVDPWTLTLDESCRLLTADPIPVSGGEQHCGDGRIGANAGLLFAAPEDVRVLAEQLARAVS